MTIQIHYGYELMNSPDKSLITSIGATTELTEIEEILAKTEALKSHAHFVKLT